MQGGDSPRSMAARELCRRCRAETERYRRREPHDDSFCFEAVQRAIAEQDQTCWRELVAIYQEQVAAWCRKAGAGPHADTDELATLAWAKFWKSYTKDKLADAGGMRAVLLYLKTCVRSVVIDEARAHTATVPLEEGPHEPASHLPPPGDQQVQEAANAELWAIVAGALRTERERTLVSLMFELGLKPAEIQARRPDLFPAATDVYRLWRNIGDRLRRNAALRRWFEDEAR